MSRASRQQHVVDRVHSCHMAVARPGSPRPEEISVAEYGHHASYVEDGCRVYGFVSERGRDLFIQNYPAEKRNAS